MMPLMLLLLISDADITLAVILFIFFAITLFFRFTPCRRCRFAAFLSLMFFTFSILVDYAMPYGYDCHLLIICH